VSNVYLLYVSCASLGLEGLVLVSRAGLGTAGLDYKTALSYMLCACVRDDDILRLNYKMDRLNF